MCKRKNEFLIKNVMWVIREFELGWGECLGVQECSIGFKESDKVGNKMGKIFLNVNVGNGRIRLNSKKIEAST